MLALILQVSFQRYALPAEFSIYSLINFATSVVFGRLVDVILVGNGLWVPFREFQLKDSLKEKNVI